MNNKLAIITVVYNNYKVIDAFIQSLKNQTSHSFHLFITDNSDKKQEIKTGLKNITIIESQNLGYSHGLNLGLDKAIDGGFEKFATVNNDIYFKEDFVEKAVESIDRNQNSIIGGKIYYAPGFEYHKNRYSKKDLGHVIWYAGGEIDWDHVLISHDGVDEIDNKQFGQSKKTDFITGCLMIFNKEVFKQIGPWDESYFLYYEDADWCIRAKKAGINLIYYPPIVIWHKNSESTGKPGSPVHIKYQNRNRLKFGLKYAPFKTKLHLIKNYLFENWK